MAQGSTWWLLGLPVVAAIAAAGTWRALPHVEGGLLRGITRDPSHDELRRKGAHLEVRGRDVVIVADSDLPPEWRGTVEARLVRMAGVRRVVTEVVVPRPMHPFRFVVLRRPSGVALEGGAPPGGAHADLTDRAAALAGGGEVEDRLRPALGAPDGFVEAATAALHIAANLSGGRVTVADGVVRVRGEASSFEGYNAAVSALARLPAGFTPGEVDITPPVADRFVWRAVKEAGRVELSGFVPSEHARERVRIAAQAGGEVDDRMQTARGVDRSIDMPAVAELTLQVLSQLERGRAELDVRRVSFEGFGPARDLLPALGQRLRAGLPKGTVVGAVTIAPIDASPFVFSAERAGRRVRLAGFAPSDADRVALAASAARRFPGEAIQDGLHVAGGAPDGFATAADLALDVLSGLAEGEARLSDRTASLSGRALYSGPAERMRQRIQGDLPRGWTGHADIVAVPYEPTLDRGLCADLLQDAVRRDGIRFEKGSAEVVPKARPVLDAVASIIRRCGPVQVRTIVRLEGSTDPDALRALAQNRAAALSASLAAMIGPTARLASEGTGSRSEHKAPSGETGEAGDLAFVVEP